MSKWIEFIRTTPNKKTEVWEIYTRGLDTYLGIIKWYAPWRRYCFFPVRETVFEEVCLRDIAKFIETETFRHKGLK